MTETNSSSNEKADPQTFPLYLQAIFTGVIMLATVGYLCVAQRQADIAADQTRILNQQRKMMAADQRPWVLFDPTPPATKRYFNIVDENAIRAHITNFGRGPAVHTKWRLWASEDAVVQIHRRDKLPPAHQWAVSHGRATLPPGDTMTIHVSWRDGFPTHPRPPTNGQTIEVLLAVTYSDTFHQWHHTFICLGAGVTLATPKDQRPNELTSCLERDFAN